MDEFSRGDFHRFSNGGLGDSRRGGGQPLTQDAYSVRFSLAREKSGTIYAPKTILFHPRVS
jgi:hypothetical protein